MMKLAALCALASTAHAAGCLRVHDAAADQELKMEAHGPNAIRVRAVPSGASSLTGSRCCSRPARLLLTCFVAVAHQAAASRMSRR